MSRQACPTEKKGAHVSLGAAHAAAHAFARKLNREGKLARSMYTYRCVCGAWHLTSRAEWHGEQLRRVYEAAPEHLQRWAMGQES